MPDGGVTPEQAGGWLAVLSVPAAGAFALVKWLWGERTRARDSYRKKLEAWDASLSDREAKFDAATGERMAALEQQVKVLTDHTAECQRQHGMLREAFILVTVELAGVRPGSPALLRARKLLGDAFPIEMEIPPDMAEALRRID